MAVETINGKGRCILLSQDETLSYLRYQLARELTQAETEYIQESNTHINISPETEASIRSTLAIIGITVMKIGVPEGDPQNN